MKTRLLLTLFTAFLFSCVQKKDNKEALHKIGGRTTAVKNQHDHTKNGFSFGREYESEIQEQIAIWEKLVKKEIDFNQQELYDYITANTGLVKACEEYTPELLEELKGMAAGAQVPYTALINLNLAEEIMLFFGQGYHSCTNIGIKTKTANYLAYNLDLPEFLRINSPYVLRKEQRIIYGFPGILAAGGVNEYFALTTNSLPNNEMNIAGLPLPFMIRKLLDAKSIDAAKNILEAVPLAAPQNFMLASRKDIIDFERSKNQLIDATQDGAICYHTNFAIKNTDIVKKEVEICERYSYLEQVSESKNVDALSTKKRLIELLKNKNPSSILNDETYLSFVAVFPKDIKKPVTFHLLPSKYFLKPELIKL